MHFRELSYYAFRRSQKRPGVFVLCTATTLLLKVVLKRGLENLKTVEVPWPLHCTTV